MHAGPTLLHAGPTLLHAGPTLLHAGPTLMHAGPTLLHAGPTLLHAGPTLLHAGPTLMLSVLSRRFHIGAQRLMRTVYRGRITCRKVAAKTKNQIMGQLPVHKVTPSPPFPRVESILLVR